MKLFRSGIGYLALLTVLVFLPSVFVHSAHGTDTPLNLPSAPVFIEVSNGTQSYFVTKLSDVPSGYDVTNESYPGWCVDVRANMTRSPATHEVRLFSSTDPPAELANNSWDMVNYILNHKQGNAQDLQQAIWYFVHMGGNYTPTRTTAWAIINDTEANGRGFSPAQGQTLAVICYPLIYSHQPDVQLSIIEITDPVIPEFPSVLALPLFMLPALFGAIAYTRRHNKH